MASAAWSFADEPRSTPAKAKSAWSFADGPQAAPVTSAQRASIEDNPPGVAPPGIPEELTAQDPINQWSGERHKPVPMGESVLDFPYTGGKKIVEGVQQALQPGMRAKAGGAAKVISGGLEAVGPFLGAAGLAGLAETAGAYGGAAAVKAAASLAGSLAAGWFSQTGTEHVLRSLDTPEEYTQLAGSLAGLAGSSAGAIGSYLKNPEFRGMVRRIFQDRLENAPAPAARPVQTNAGVLSEPPPETIGLKDLRPGSEFDAPGGGQTKVIKVQGGLVNYTGADGKRAALPTKLFLGLVDHKNQENWAADQFSGKPAVAEQPPIVTPAPGSPVEPPSDGVDLNAQTQDIPAYRPNALPLTTAVAQAQAMNGSKPLAETQEMPAYQVPPQLPNAPATQQGEGNALHIQALANAAGALPTVVPGTSTDPAVVAAAMHAMAVGGPAPNLSATQEFALPAREGVIQPSPEPEVQSSNAERATPGSGPVQPEGKSGSLPGSRPPSKPVAVGEATEVEAEGRSKPYQARYTVRELEDTYPSHDPFTFEKNPDYHFKNTRDYKLKINQERPITNSLPGVFNPRKVINTNPDAVNGPPVWEPDGNVLGGNNRRMALERVYSLNPQGAKAYKELLIKHADHFGLDPEAIRQMKRPILGREINEEELNRQQAIGDFNKSPIGGHSAGERAEADAGQLKPETGNYLWRVLEAFPDSSLSEVLDTKRGPEVVNHLISSGVFTATERNELLDATSGDVTKAGKDRIAKMLLGGIFRDSEQFQAAEPVLRNKLERVAPILKQMEGRSGGWDLMPDIRQALDVLEFEREYKKTYNSEVGGYLEQNQVGMFGNAPQPPQATRSARALGAFIKKHTPTAIARAFRLFAEKSNETDLFRASSPGDAFTEAFGARE